MKADEHTQGNLLVSSPSRPVASMQPGSVGSAPPGGSKFSGGGYGGLKPAFRRKAARVSSAATKGTDGRGAASSPGRGTDGPCRKGGKSAPISAGASVIHETNTLLCEKRLAEETK